LDPDQLLHSSVRRCHGRDDAREPVREPAPHHHPSAARTLHLRSPAFESGQFGVSGAVASMRRQVIDALTVKIIPLRAYSFANCSRLFFPVFFTHSFSPNNAVGCAVMPSIMRYTRRTFVLPSIIKPFNEICKPRLTSDMTGLEFSLSTFISCSKARTNTRAAAAGLGLGPITVLTMYGPS
jgi:hypothetical protein